ncbi:hypothetical protein AB4Z43_28640 [Mesorhizobium sp. 2RAF45]|uniref:hypothetical protein n=1 Tax=Mesorhizobium sp. 2RAF45 TaxID=3233001 RepID=UPI003F9B1F1E
MLRRAALVIRNTGGIDLDPGVQDTLSDIAVEMGLTRSDLIKTVAIRIAGIVSSSGSA